MPDTHRKLAAIMFADMIGFTAVMQTNEHLAHTMRRRQREVITEMHERNNGTIVQIYGDGALSMFDSAVDAVRCGIAIQQALLKEPVVPLRIGVHMGEVVIDEDGIYGNSVNVAARIESLSVKGAVLISGKVNEELNNHPEFATVPIGEYKMKNVTNPMKVYAINAGGLPIPDAAMLYSPKASRVHSIAVLPFVNMASDPENEYFSDGITEELINRLVRIDGLKVTARTSSFSFKGHNEDIRTLGKKLGVTSILEGSVRKSGTRIRITAQLINTEDGFHLFSETWDRNSDDIFQVQDEIASEVASMLSVSLEKQSAPKETGFPGKVNLDAYHLYLKALSDMKELSPNTLGHAIKHCERAIEIQPDFGLAYSVLSAATMLRGVLGLGSSRDAYEQGRNYAFKALSLDPSIGPAYVTIAGAQMYNDWDFAGAEESFMKGFRMSPGDVELHILHSTLLSILQRHDEAIDESRHAVTLDPVSNPAIRGYIITLLLARRYYEGLDVFNTLYHHNSHPAMVNELKGWIFAFMGEIDRAYSVFLENKELIATSDISDGFRNAVGLGYTQAMLGHTQEAQACMETLQEKSKIQPNGMLLIDLATISAGLKDFDQAMRYLEEAADQRIGMVLHIRNLPVFDVLNDHPAYEALVGKIGLPRRKLQAAS